MNIHYGRCLAKHRRAELHIEELERESRQWLEGEPYDVADEFDAQSGDHVVRCKTVPDPPPDLGVIAGDALFDLRSSLDNLVYCLAVESSKRDPPRSESTLQFPIFDTEDNFRSKGARRIKSLPEPIQAAIQSLQPYQPGNGDHKNKLWVLNFLDNINKHRRVHLVPMCLGVELRFAPDAPGIEISYLTPPGVIEGDQVLLRYRTTTDPNATLNPDFTFEIALSEPTVLSEGTKAVPLLRDLSQFVGEILSEFGRLFVADDVGQG